MKILIAILTLISISTFTYAKDLYWYENYNDALNKAANDNKLFLLILLVPIGALGA